jgi:phosphatidylglycerophosphatase A
MIEIALVLFGLIFAVACVRFGGEAERELARKDPPEIVADEVAGQVIPLLFLPWRPPVDGPSWGWNIALAATAFITFRIFDISKFPPARQTERLGRGWGILVDDLVAGMYALIVTQVIVRVALPLI